MNNYLFETTVTMKEYNNNKWWINSDIIKRYYITAKNVNEALEKYRTYVYNDSCIDISNNALKNKNDMFIDTENGTKQTGYVITGSTEFENNYKWTKQYIDLWVSINTIIDTIF